MIIEFVNIEVSSVSGTGGKTGYSKGKVNFIDPESGRNRSKTMMSFANPKVFATLQAAQEGQRYEITTRKDGEFENWTSATLATADAATPQAGSNSQPAGATSTRATTAPVSQYETRDERNARQRLIVRQSSLTAALGTLTPGSKGTLDPDVVEDLANRYAAFVYQEPVKVAEVSLADMESDLPY